MNTDNFEEETEANEVQLLSVALTLTLAFIAPIVIVWQIASALF